MNKAKMTDEKNSLEQLLLRGKESYDQNKAKTLQFVLLFVLVVVVVMMIRSGVFRGADKGDMVDSAYYAATQASFAGVGAPDGASLAATAAAYNKSKSAATLHAEAGEAFVRCGLSDVARKQRYSAGSKLQEGETLVDPKDNLNAAVSEFEAVAASKNADLSARALYGCGIAYEVLASVAENDDQVVANLNEAKARYEQVASVAANSPYAPLAAERLASVAKDQTVAYYKTVAHAFVTLPDPTTVPSITSGDDSLEAGSALNVGEEFKLNEDAPAVEEAPSPEAAE